MKENHLWDIIIIGGGATGLGIAVDAASRGYTTLLLEQSDFAKGTSSRSTKLVHGGVRYLAQGNFRLVYEALDERGILLRNAPHLVHSRSFIVPSYAYSDQLKYWTGLKLYDLMSGRLSFGSSVYLSREKLLELMPGIRSKELCGGVEYFDGQFDDARMAINLAQTSAESGAVVLNYMQVTGFQKTNGRVSGVVAKDMETGTSYQVRAKVVVNATGVFVDSQLHQGQPSGHPLVRPSQGIHLVVDSSFLPGQHALMIPKTSDGRVLFAVPWQNHLLLGTTDTPLEKHSLEPVAMEQEISFILDTVSQYLTRPPKREDVLSIFAGLRPLAATNNSQSTKELSRGHRLEVSTSGLVTITGGKWTTYRRMAREVIDSIIKRNILPGSPCKTKSLAIHGNTSMDIPGHLAIYGSDAAFIRQLIREDASLSENLSPLFPNQLAEVVWAARYEMARTVEDVLARRLRFLFLNAEEAVRAAPKVAAILQKELGRTNEWKEEQLCAFNALAQPYQVSFYS